MRVHKCFLKEVSMLCGFGHFVDTSTPVPGSGSVLISIPTGLTAVSGGTLINRGHNDAKGANLIFSTNKNDGVGHSIDGAWNDFLVDGQVSKTWSFGVTLYCEEVHASGSDIKLKIKNSSATPTTLAMNLTYFVCGL